MTPYILTIILIWPAANPAASMDKSAVIQRETFADQQICEVALKEYLEMAKKTYAIPGVRLKYGCIPAEGDPV